MKQLFLVLLLFALACSDSHDGGDSGADVGSDARTDSGTDSGRDADCRGRFCCTGGTATPALGECGASSCPDGTEPQLSCEDFVSERSCELTSRCTRRANDCCGFGGETASDWSAVHQDESAAFEAWQACPDDIACPPVEPEPQPYIVPTCLENTCQLVDIREEELTQCTDASDCRIRTNDCCECGGGTGPESLVAISGPIEPIVCDSILIGCPECAPSYPDDVRAVCTDGVCLVER